MFPTYVALVPYDPRAGSPPVAELMHVAAALQTQVIRDFGPIWGVSGVISPFEKLDDVPPGYVPMAILNRPLPARRRAFHFTVGGLPFGVVRYCEAWSLAASHELLEILWDASGQKTATGPSLADDKKQALGGRQVSDAKVVNTGAKGGSYKDQGQVDYLMEICDPCESSTYKVNDVLVSDFVTPRYYDQFNSECGCYSFTGRIKRPRQILEGGYISWRSRPGTRSPASSPHARPSGLIYQAASVPSDTTTVVKNALASTDQQPTPPQDLKITRLEDVPSRFSREWIDSQTAPTAPFSPPIKRAPPFKPTSGQWARTFREDVKLLLTLLGATEEGPTLDEVIRKVEDLKAERKAGAVGAGSRTLFNRPASDKLLTVDQYDKLLDHLKNQKRVSGLFGPDIVGSDLALWMCMLTN